MVQNLGKDAFSGCTSLKSVHFDPRIKGLKLGNSAFFCCNSLVEVCLPEKVKKLGNDVFAHCPDSLTLHVPSGCMANFQKPKKWMQHMITDDLPVVEADPQDLVQTYELLKELVNHPVNYRKTSYSNYRVTLNLQDEVAAPYADGRNIYVGCKKEVDSIIRLLNYLSYRSGVNLDYRQKFDDETYDRILFGFIDNIYFCVKHDLSEVEFNINKIYYKRGAKKLS